MAGEPTRYCHKCNRYVPVANFGCSARMLCKDHAHPKRGNEATRRLYRAAMRDKDVYLQTTHGFTFNCLEWILQDLLDKLPGEKPDRDLRIVPLDPRSEIGPDNYMIVTALGRRTLIKAWKANGLEGHQVVVENLGSERLK